MSEPTFPGARPRYLIPIIAVVLALGYYGRSTSNAWAEGSAILAMVGVGAIDVVRRYRWWRAIKVSRTLDGGDALVAPPPLAKRGPVSTGPLLERAHCRLQAQAWIPGATRALWVPWPLATLSIEDGMLEVRVPWRSLWQAPLEHVDCSVELRPRSFPGRSRLITLNLVGPEGVAPFYVLRSRFIPGRSVRRLLSDIGIPESEQPISRDLWFSSALRTVRGGSSPRT